MARPSLPAAIAPFRGCPAGCLRVACETLLSPSTLKGRINNGPRQAVALNNPFPCFHLPHFPSSRELTTSYSCKTYILSPIQYFPSETIFFTLFLILSFPFCMKICSRLSMGVCWPQLFSGFL